MQPLAQATHTNRPTAHLLTESGMPAKVARVPIESRQRINRANVSQQRAYTHPLRLTRRFTTRLEAARLITCRVGWLVNDSFLIRQQAHVARLKAVKALLRTICPSG